MTKCIHCSLNGRVDEKRTRYCVANMVKNGFKYVYAKGKLDLFDECILATRLSNKNHFTLISEQSFTLHEEKSRTFE